MRVSGRQCPGEFLGGPTEIESEATVFVLRVAEEGN
jgi:hypothetical protein